MSVTPQKAQFNEPLQLESGKLLSEYSISYETYGKLNQNCDNAILVCHTLTKGAHLASRHLPNDSRPGWWDNMVGPGKPLDTTKYLVICSDTLAAGGSSGPASIDPASKRNFGLDFPVITIADMVEAQKKLVDHLNVNKLFAVIGGCFGGQQVLEWIIRHPERMDKAVIISAGPATSAHTIAVFNIMRRLITSDPNWSGGDYYGRSFPTAGLANALIAGVPMWMSRNTMEQKFGRQRLTSGDYSYSFKPEFLVEKYLEQIASFGKTNLDPNSLLYLTRAMEYFDLAMEYGSLEDALAPVRASVMLINYRSDWRYPPEEAMWIDQVLKQQGKHSEVVVLDNKLGHSAFVHDVSDISPAIERFLCRISPRSGFKGTKGERLVLGIEGVLASD